MQYIGVYEVVFGEEDDIIKKIIFLDIFGYEVFMAMCVCGVKVMDIVVIIIVVDDNIMF